MPDEQKSQADNGLVPAAILTAPGAEYGPASRAWQGIPGIERAPRGRLWATWYTGGVGEGPNNHVVLATSADDGRTWLDPVLIVKALEGCRCFDPCLWCDPAGRLWLFYAQGAAWFDGRNGVWAVRTDTPDAPRPTWTAPRRIANGIMMNKPTVLATGEWLLPCAIWANNEPKRPELAAERFSNVVCSTDGGETFTLRGGADVPDRTFDEHMIIERRDGSLWMLVRTRYGVGESFSRDGGRTWSPGRPSRIAGPNSRFFIRRLDSGKLLLVNHDRPPEAGPDFRLRANMTAWLSEDDGETWIGGLLLDGRKGVSYPDGVQAPDGRIYVTYDCNRGDKHALGRDREILLAVFTEEDVLARKPVSKACRLGIVISRATGP